MEKEAGRDEGGGIEHLGVPVAGAPDDAAGAWALCLPIVEGVGEIFGHTLKFTRVHMQTPAHTPAHTYTEGGRREEERWDRSSVRWGIGGWSARLSWPWRSERRARFLILNTERERAGTWRREGGREESPQIWKELKVERRRDTEIQREARWGTWGCLTLGRPALPPAPEPRACRQQRECEKRESHALTQAQAQEQALAHKTLTVCARCVCVWLLY